MLIRSRHDIMPQILRYITHPQVQIDPSIPVPKWGLSQQGRTRAKCFASLPILNSTKTIISSAETKAIETAIIISDAIDVPVIIREKTHENDRSATGFLEPNEFERVADLFFSKPLESVLGWETATHSQSRIVTEAMKVIQDNPNGDILLVGHGAVGTLLYCSLSNIEISRKFDQPSGGGNIFSYNVTKKAVLHHWISIEQIV